ncbi:MAG: hypothetical protein WCJ75_11090 [Desulfomonile sp.]
MIAGVDPRFKVVHVMVFKNFPHYVFFAEQQGFLYDHLEIDYF